MTHIKIKLTQDHNHDGTNHQAGAEIIVPEKLGLHLVNNLKIADAVKEAPKAPEKQKAN